MSTPATTVYTADEENIFYETNKACLLVLNHIRNGRH